MCFCWIYAFDWCISDGIYLFKSTILWCKINLRCYEIFIFEVNLCEIYLYHIADMGVFIVISDQISMKSILMTELHWWNSHFAKYTIFGLMNVNSKSFANVIMSTVFQLWNAIESLWGMDRIASIFNGMKIGFLTNSLVFCMEEQLNSKSRNWKSKATNREFIIAPFWFFSNEYECIWQNVNISDWLLWICNMNQKLQFFSL